MSSFFMSASFSRATGPMQMLLYSTARGDFADSPPSARRPARPNLLLTPERDSEAMDAITLLHTRYSASKLGDPAPSPESVRALLESAAHVPDHGRLLPWRVIV